MNLRRLLRQLTPAVIQQVREERARIVRLEALAEKRRKLMAALAVIDREMAKLDGTTTASSKPRRKRWKLSAATRAKMRAAALRRYGKAKAEPEASKPDRKVRKLSAAGRAAISAAAKARWERVRDRTVRDEPTSVKVGAARPS